MTLYNRLGLFKKCYQYSNKEFHSLFANMKIENMYQIKSCSDLDAAEVAAKLLSSGEVIAVPTDTVYGLACSANCPIAIKKLYGIKGRDALKPVAICVTNIEDVKKWGVTTHLPDGLLEKLLPGPVTIVLNKTKLLDNPFLNPHTQKIGIRIPHNSFINKVTGFFDMPMALTSANPSSQPATLRVAEFEDLFPKLGAIFDGGILSDGLNENRTGSTVIDLAAIGSYTIVRHGISCNSLVNVLKKFGLKCKE